MKGCNWRCRWYITRWDDNCWAIKKHWSVEPIAPCSSHMTFKGKGAAGRAWHQVRLLVEQKASFTLVKESWCKGKRKERMWDSKY